MKGVVSVLCFVSLVVLPLSWATSTQLEGMSRNCLGAECLGPVSGSIEVGIAQRAIDYCRTNLIEPALKASNIVSRADDPNKTNFLKEMADKDREISVGLGQKFKLEELFLSALDIDVGKSRVDFAAPDAINVNIAGLKLTMNLHMQYKGLFGSYKPRVVKVIVKDSSLALKFAVGMEGGRPTVTSIAAPDLILKRENFDIQWLSAENEKPKGFFNWLINLFEGMITRILSSQLRKQFNKNFNPKMAAVLRSLPTEMRFQNPKLPKPIKIKALLSRAPAVTAKGVRISLDGDVAIEGQSCSKQTCPDTGSGLGIPVKYLNIMLSERLPCCAIRAGFDMGFLTKVVKDIPTPEFPNTGDKVKDAVAAILRKIFSTYSLKVMVDVPTVPVVKFVGGNKASVAATVNAEVHLVQKANAAAPLTDATRQLRVDVNVKATANTAIRGSTLTYGLEDVSVENTKLELKPGKPVPETIRAAIFTFANWVVKNQVIGQVNKIIEKGFEIPSVQGLTFVQPSLSIHTGSVEVNSDFTFAFPADAITQMLLNL